jgi:hypothetical protein
MNQPPYIFERYTPKRYIFTSTGKQSIVKVVDFTFFDSNGIVNLGFGDLAADGTVDDNADSNNGDMIKVLATVIQILKDFTAQHPNIEIFFTGSNYKRTRFYARILKTYYSEFSKDFTISAATGSPKILKRVPFDPKLNTEYFAFLVKRIY